MAHFIPLFRKARPNLQLAKSPRYVQYLTTQRADSGLSRAPRRVQKHLGYCFELMSNTYGCTFGLSGTPAGLAD